MLCDGLLKIIWCLKHSRRTQGPSNFGKPLVDLAVAVATTEHGESGLLEVAQVHEVSRPFHHVLVLSFTRGIVGVDSELLRHVEALCHQCLEGCGDRMGQQGHLKIGILDEVRHQNEVMLLQPLHQHRHHAQLRLVEMCELF